MTGVVVHASTVAFDPGAALMVTGPSGAGKSRLAMALIARGARLVADDRTLVWRCGGALFARAPRSIAGLIELRGLGLLRLPALRLARVMAVVDLSQSPARMPDPDHTVIDGVELPLVHAVAASFPDQAAPYIMDMIRRQAHP